LDLGLTGKRALIGGGASGIGRGIAGILHEEGAQTALIGRNSERVRAYAQEIAGVAVVIDLATEAGPSSAVGMAVDQLGGLDILVVNSGGPPPGDFADLDEETWAAAIEGTLQTSLRLIRAALPHLRAGVNPAILINLSSSVREPIPGLLTSNVLRPALVGLIKSLTTEIAPIRINGVAPGRISTDRISMLDRRRAEGANVSVEQIEQQTLARIPLGRYGTVAEIGRVAAFLVSPAATYVTGQVVGVDGGMVRSLP